MRRVFLYALTVTAFTVINMQQILSQKNILNEVEKTVEVFWKTSPFSLDQERESLLRTFETYSDNFPNTLFKEYMVASDEVAEEMEGKVPILYFYRNAFDKVFNEIKTAKVEEGTALIWMLYNMGFIVKTPSGCFGIDIDHRYAEKLEPYLDFLFITHNHGDHYNIKLIEAMKKSGKPILSNFYKDDIQYYSTTASKYKIGAFTITTDISDHLRSPELQDFVTLFRIDCGNDSGDFSLLHCGDSGFIPERFKNVQGPVNLIILRWGAPRENEILGTGEGQVLPNYAALSHLIELRHKPYPNGQASITKTLEHLPNVQCDNTFIPFWGEKMMWKDGQLF